FWQCSGSDLSHGARGRIDLNAFHSDEGAWRAWAG
ncbi:MAG: muramidase, partial [Mesorhizobium sp.]